MLNGRGGGRGNLWRSSAGSLLPPAERRVHHQIGVQHVARAHVEPGAVDARMKRVFPLPAPKRMAGMEPTPLAAGDDLRSC